MDDGERPTSSIRRRTESNSGSSDSELSEGWNIVDQGDVTGLDVSSSDGESIEVIEAEEAFRENVTDSEHEGDPGISLVPNTAVMALPKLEVSAISPVIHREEMFDPSFRWFLIYATAAVLVSNIVLMVAESVFAWNADVHTESPSFLRDFPTIPNLNDRNKLAKNIPWNEKEDFIVEQFDEKVNYSGSKTKRKEQNGVRNNNQQYRSSNKRIENDDNERSFNPTNDKFVNIQTNEKIPKHKNQPQQEKTQKLNEMFGEYHARNTINNLISSIRSSETKYKLERISIHLENFYSTLADLEVYENSIAPEVLDKHKHKLIQIVTEIESAVAKSVDKLATNTLIKVEKIERRLKNQLCELGKRGLSEGLSFHCQQKKQPQLLKQHGFKTSETKKKIISTKNDVLKDVHNFDERWNSFDYQVDKDSPGKEHSKSHDDKMKHMDGWYVLVNSDVDNSLDPLNKMDIKDNISTKENYSKHTKDIKEDYNKVDGKIKSTDGKGKHYRSEKHNEKSSNKNKMREFKSKGKYYVGDRKFGKDRENTYFHNEEQTNKNSRNNKVHNNDERNHNAHSKNEGNSNNKNWRFNDDDDGRSQGKLKKRRLPEEKNHQDKHTDPNKKTNTNNEKFHEKSDQFVPNAAVKSISKYLKESCKKGNYKVKGTFEKLKSYIDHKLIPKQIFDSIFVRYCKMYDDSFQWEKRSNREHPKGDFRWKSHENMFKDEVTIDDLNKNVGIVDISEIIPDNNPLFVRDDLIMSDNQPRSWVLKEDEMAYDNKSNLTGDWFFKAGESRTEMRWRQRRSDWLFDRASHRRRTHSRSINWYSDRRKNWYFRRAWARENCRPHDKPCHFSQETITITDSNVNLS